MQHAGPPLESLTRRLLDTPPEFLAEPKIGSRGVVHVDALLGDVTTMLGERAPAGELRRFADPVGGARNRLALAQLAAWVCADAWFRGAGIAPVRLIRAIDAAATALSSHAPAASFLADGDRREELVRTLLAALDHRPADESIEQAQDRLANVSSSQRQIAVSAARGMAERARKIREALARKAAEESADKMWRE